ncbi:hypothetical protein UlMin_039911 [Ulmus minor]
MPQSYFPLRWESTGDQWWYASPIDWAAANGLYDIVRELLHLDTNLLIKLTSLRRIRRLESVWDDEAQFDDVARCRSYVARNLLKECETKSGHNSLLRAGYGGWLLYTAASSGDVGFVRELLERDPLVVYGEGEYGVTDIFYAAARSKNSEVFRLLLDFSLSPRCSTKGEAELDFVSSEFKWEMINRAVHASARGGNLEMLKELLGDGSTVLSFRDAQGYTVLHSASGRGQVEVVKYLIASFDIITSIDNQGNTALHVAAYRGHLPVVEVLILASPSLITLSNNCGDTFLHMAVAGFRAPGFRRVDRQIELVKQVLSGNIVNVEEIINLRNNDGRTALHMAVGDRIHVNLVELLMTVRSINLNIRDGDGMTPLDLLRQCPHSASSEILIKQLISAGGISNCQDHKTRNALVSHLKLQGIGGSPGTSFQIPDAEIFLYTGIDNGSEVSCDQESVRSSSHSGELGQFESSHSNKKPVSINHAAKRLKFLLRWAKKKDKRSARTESGEENSLDSFIFRGLEDNVVPLRQIYSKSSSLSKNGGTFSAPSPSTKMKFSAGLMHGVIKTTPHSLHVADQSSSSSITKSSSSSPAFVEKENSFEIVGASSSTEKDSNLKKLEQSSFDKKLMNQYLCFGAQGLAVEDSMSCTRSQQSYRQFSSLVA